jgi:hypothetical protein
MLPHDHPLYIPWRKHCFSGCSYPGYAKKTLQEYVVPVPRWRRALRVHYHPSKVEKILYWIGYTLRLPFGCFDGLLRLLIAPVLYPALYLLYREFIYAPLQRRCLREVMEEGVGVVGKIQMNRSGKYVKAIGFDVSRHSPLVANINQGNLHESLLIDDDDDDCDCYHYEYQFCNDRSEVNALLDKNYDELVMGEEFSLTVVPYRHPAAYWSNFNNVYLTVWTPVLLRTKKQQTPPFSLQRLLLSALAGILFWNLAALLLFHLPVFSVLYLFFIPPDETSQLRSFWDCYQITPWYASIYFLGGLTIVCKFKPLSYWDHIYVATPCTVAAQNS